MAGLFATPRSVKDPLGSNHQIPIVVIDLPKYLQNTCKHSVVINKCCWVYAITTFMGFGLAFNGPAGFFDVATPILKISSYLCGKIKVISPIFIS